MKKLRWMISSLIFVSSVSSAAYQCGEAYQSHLPTYTYSNDRVVAEKIDRFLATPEATSASEVRLSTHDRLLVRSIAWSMVTGAIAKPIKKLLALDKPIEDLGVKPTTPLENRALDLFASMVEQKTLRAYLNKILATARSLPVVGSKLQNLSDEKAQKGIKIVVDAIENMVWVRGKLPQARHIQYREWAEINKEMEAKLEMGIPLMELAKTEYQPASNVRILVDGPASFSLREKLMNEAEQSIDILLWSLENDSTGMALANKLMDLKRAKPHLKLRVMVDGRTSHRIGYTEQLKRMEESGLIDVIRWHDALQPYAGQHKKMFIVDGTHLISGGMNAGDVYSHKAKDPKQHWRDTDIYIGGQAVNQANTIFARMWNMQVRSHQLPMAMMPVAKAKEVEGPITEKVALINFDPNSQLQVGSPIFMAILKSIRDAKETVEVSNAYLIALPPLVKEIESAIKRGVKVRLLTNSQESTDEPVIARPILRSALHLASLGAEVYVRTGSTLHTKTMVVDSQISFIMSYNLHPSSERLETEVAVMLDDARVGRQMSRQFQADLAPKVARRIDPNKEKVEDDFILNLTLRLMFDRL
jgi:phosphatidylserine/phosphatidylglycerophosphate/cardiolipin synthase-like enzyme